MPNQVTAPIGRDSVPWQRASKYGPRSPAAAIVVDTKARWNKRPATRSDVRSAPVVVSQIRTVASSPVEASQDPSGATTNASTLLVWPVRVWRGGAGGR